jgi:uncharacterized membrane protein
MQKIRHSRSIAKALSWRAVGSIATFTIAFIVTGKVDASVFIVGTEVVAKTALYYFHERGWNYIKWGLAAPAQDVTAKIRLPANSDADTPKIFPKASEQA